jgi:dTDP-4-dehydrorhamnose reductase
MRILILGASGMLGHTMLRVFSSDPLFIPTGVVRSQLSRKYFHPSLQGHIVDGGDALDFDSLAKIILATKPQVIINCIGLIKQFSSVDDPLVALPINSILPHRLARLSSLCNARFIHISTDCVFSGLANGGYVESDVSDAIDLYGKSKYIGEVKDQYDAITLRTSIIGHELNSKNGLLEWFLSQPSSVKGYSKAIFSGLPTFELANIIKNIVIPDPKLSGLYHISSEAIDKFSLLQLIRDDYSKDNEIVTDETVVINRSLDSSKFFKATGYISPKWPALIREMHKDFNGLL